MTGPLTQVLQASDQQLAQMSHENLYNARQAAEAAGNTALDIRLAPFEHQAFAREFTTEHPLLAGASLSFAIPAYAAGKVLNLDGLMNHLTGDTGPTTPPSLDQIIQGYRGIGQGLIANLPDWSK